MRSRLAFVLVFAACGVSPPAPLPPDPDVTYEKDIAPLVQAHCQGCHKANGIAPFSLMTFEDVSAMKTQARADLESRKMPPFLAARDCASYQNDLTLTDAEIALFGKWIDFGAARGTPSAQQPGAMNPPLDTLPRVDATLSLAAPYTATASPDDYRCFVLDWTEAAARYVTGFRVAPGNPKIVHHVVAFIADATQGPMVQQLDDADAAPGYPCFGGPGAGIQTWLGAWAPGGMGGMYPPDTGIRVEPGSKIVLQVHYNLQSAAGDTSDQTHVEVALADSVAHPAILLPWANYDWSMGSGMDIPAFQADVEHDFLHDPTPYMAQWSGGQIQANVPLHLYSASLHQHLLGKSSRLEILRKTGGSECLLDIPRWDFHWQRSYRFTESKVLNPGDKLKVTCHWDNSAAAQPLINGVQQTPRDVKWGENTTDEMCLGVVYVTN